MNMTATNPPKLKAAPTSVPLRQRGHAVAAELPCGRLEADYRAGVMAGSAALIPDGFRPDSAGELRCGFAPNETISTRSEMLRIFTALHVGLIVMLRSDETGIGNPFHNTYYLAEAIGERIRMTDNEMAFCLTAAESIVERHWVKIRLIAIQIRSGQTVQPDAALLASVEFLEDFGNAGDRLADLH